MRNSILHKSVKHARFCNLDSSPVTQVPILSTFYVWAWSATTIKFYFFKYFLCIHLEQWFPKCVLRLSMGPNPILGGPCNCQVDSQQGKCIKPYGNLKEKHVHVDL